MRPGTLLLRTEGACDFDPEHLIDVFVEQRRRFVTVLEGFAPEDWAGPTRFLSPTPPNGRRGIKRCSDQGVKSMHEAGRHKLWSTRDVKRTRHRQQVTHQSA